MKSMRSSKKSNKSSSSGVKCISIVLYSWLQKKQSKQLIIKHFPEYDKESG